MTEAVPSYLSPTGQEIVFLLLSAVAVGSALLVVTTRQLVHAALWLVVCFGALAGCYLVLTAEFVAWVQVLIYVGAVVVLMLFGIMLTRAPIGRSADLDSGNRLVSAVVALATAAILVTVVIDGFRTAYAPLTPGPGSASQLGASVFATWVLPFEALSVLLLAALIGAIVLSRTDIPGGAVPAQPADSPARTPDAPSGHTPGTSTGHTSDAPTGHTSDAPTGHTSDAPTPRRAQPSPGAGEATAQGPGESPSQGAGRSTPQSEGEATPQGAGEAPPQTGDTSAPDQPGGQ